MKIKLKNKADIKNLEEKVIISISKTKKISLKEKFEKYNGKNLSKDFSWDNSIGNEIW